MALDPERYVIGDDGLLVEKVGPWAKDKLEIVADYIQISGPTRRKYCENRPAFIDVFCGPGRSLVRGDGDYIDGSPVARTRRTSLRARVTRLHLDPCLLVAASIDFRCFPASGHCQRVRYDG